MCPNSHPTFSVPPRLPLFVPGPESAQEPFRSHVLVSRLLYQQQETPADPRKRIISVLPTSGNAFPHDGASFPVSAFWPPLKKLSQRGAIKLAKNYPDHDTAFGSTWLLVPHPQNIHNALCLASKEERTRREGRWMEGRRKIPQTTHAKTHTDRKGRSEDNCRGIFWIFFP